MDACSLLLNLRSARLSKLSRLCLSAFSQGSSLASSYTSSPLRGLLHPTSHSDESFRTYYLPPELSFHSCRSNLDSLLQKVKNTITSEPATLTQPITLNDSRQLSIYVHLQSQNTKSFPFLLPHILNKLIHNEFLTYARNFRWHYHLSTQPDTSKVAHHIPPFINSFHPPV